MDKKIEVFVQLSLMTVLILTQTPPALTIFLSDTLKNQNGAGLSVGTARGELLANGWGAWMW